MRKSSVVSSSELFQIYFFSFCKKKQYPNKSQWEDVFQRDRFSVQNYFNKINLKQHEKNNTNQLFKHNRVQFICN